MIGLINLFQLEEGSRPLFHSNVIEKKNSRKNQIVRSFR